MALPWYLGLGGAFLSTGTSLLQIVSYKIAFHFIPANVWGIWYVLIGVGVLVSASVPRIPHRYVRLFVGAGFSTTIFFLITFILWDALHGVPPNTLIPAFAFAVLVEYRALREPPTNPAFQPLRTNGR